jgi:endonuclease/exonuclease/phosphatase family metal-dependent hydrolase
VRKGRSIRLAWVAWLAASAGCASASNYLDPREPRYVGGPEAPADTRETAAAGRASIRVVTFNIQFAKRVDEAIAGLRETPALRDPDLLLLQEMDAAGVQRIAAAFGFNYVYYPASRHSGTGRDLGNAILSPWPIDDDAKLPLPYVSRGLGQARAAVSARVRVRGRDLRVYSLHLGAPFGASPGERRAQADRVMADAAARGLPAIVGGDLNSHGLGRRFVEAGYAWPTRDVGGSVRGRSFDHVLVRGLRLAPATRAAVARELADASDHRPVWAELVVE